MSHFTVMVRVPASTQRVDILSAVDQFMLPFETNTKNPDWLSFQDIEEEYVGKYATESASMVRLVDGTVKSLHEFKNPELFGDPRYILPNGAVEFEMRLNERYATFEEYMMDFCGHDERDNRTGRYGYWRNPNAKWDYWRVGGRWRGHLLVKEGRNDSGYGDMSYEWKDGKQVPSSDRQHADYARISVIDMKAVEAETTQRMNEFWSQWQEFVDGKEFVFMEGPRDNALDMGLLDCKNKSELTGTEWKIMPWDRKDLDEPRFDVLKPLTREELDTNYRNFFNVLSTWAYLDSTGWHEKGKMGWWAMSNANPSSITSYNDQFSMWINDGDRDDWVVVVDCHI